MNFCLVSQIVLDDLSRAKEGFVFAFNLYLVYLIIPISNSKDPDFWPRSHPYGQFGGGRTTPMANWVV
jgi:hypothetical protein